MIATGGSRVQGARLHSRPRPRSPTGRGRPLKRVPVWVRTPPGAPPCPPLAALTCVNALLTAAVIMACPVVSGATPGFARWLCRIRAEVSAASEPARPRDAPAGGLLLAGDALGVDLQQHREAVAGPLGDLGRRHPGVEPRRHRGVPQVVRPARRAVTPPPRPSAPAPGPCATPGSRCSPPARRRAPRGTAGRRARCRRLGQVLVQQRRQRRATRARSASRPWPGA